MALNITGQVLTKYKADTTDHMRKLKKLRGAERDASKAKLDSLEKENDKLDGQIATLGKIGLAVGALAGSWMAAKASLEAYTKETQLRTAAAGIDIGKLQEASRGLLTEMQLLELSAQAQNSAYGATQKELETLGQAYTLLVSRGHDGAKVFEELKKAAIEANGEGLKPLGLQLNVQSDTLKGHTDLFAGLRKEVAAAGGDFAIAGESIAQATVDMDDSMHDLKSSVGELVVELAPAIKGVALLIKGLAKLVGTIADVAPGSDTKRGIEKIGRMSKIAIAQGRDETLQAVFGVSPEGIAAERAEATKGVVESLQRVDSLLTQIEKGRAGARKKRRARRGGGRKARDRDDFGVITDSIHDLDGGPSIDLLMGEAIEGESQTRAAAEEFAAQLREIAGQDDQPSLAEQILGKPEEFDAMRLAVDGLSGALGDLRGASEGAFAAWASGAKTMKEAAKSMFDSFLQSLAKRMFAKGLDESALALASIAAWDGAGAAKHGAAAAAFFTGAGVVGRMTHNAGAAGRGAAATSTPAGSTGPTVGSSTSGAGGSSVTVFVGSDFSGGDRRQQSQRLAKILKEQGHSPDGTVTFA